MTSAELEELAKKESFPILIINGPEIAIENLAERLRRDGYTADEVQGPAIADSRSKEKIGAFTKKFETLRDQVVLYASFCPNYKDSEDIFTFSNLLEDYSHVEPCTIPEGNYDLLTQVIGLKRAARILKHDSQELWDKSVKHNMTGVVREYNSILSSGDYSSLIAITGMGSKIERTKEKFRKGLATIIPTKKEYPALRQIQLLQEMRLKIEKAYPVAFGEELKLSPPTFNKVQPIEPKGLNT
jgi:hypothetical protein